MVQIPRGVLYSEGLCGGPRGASGLCGCLGIQELLGFQELKLPGFSGPSGTPGAFWLREKGAWLSAGEHVPKMHLKGHLVANRDASKRKYVENTS